MLKKIPIFLSNFSKNCFSSKQKTENVLSLNTLKELIVAKKIHTVNIGFPDHYGRLMGKRFDAEFFLDSVMKDGGHACNYLLSCDLFMETPPEIAKWESGFFDKL